MLLPLLLCPSLVRAEGPSTDTGTSACRPPHDTLPFCNSSLPLDTRVWDLVRRIKDADKPALLTARGHGGGLPNQGRQAFPELGVPSFYWGSNCLQCVTLCPHRPPPQPPPHRSPCHLCGP